MMTPPQTHEKRALVHAPVTLSERLSDSVVAGMGSWRFILIQTALVALWMAMNVWLLSRPFDPFPFILLNLAFSTQAAYASPLILMSGNRTAAKDRARDDQEAEEVDLLFHINQRQVVMLEQQHELSRELHQLVHQQAQEITLLRQSVASLATVAHTPDGRLIQDIVNANLANCPTSAEEPEAHGQVVDPARE